MQLDVRTIVWLIALSSLMTGLAMFLVAGSFPEQVRGIRRWAWACLMHALGWSLVALRGAIPDALSIVAANTLIAAATIANFHALLDFLHLRFSPRPFYAFLLVIAAALAFWTFEAPDMSARIVVMSAISAGFLGLCGTRLIFPRGRFEWPRGITQRTMILGFWGCSLAAALRLWHTLTQAPSQNLFTFNWVEGLFYGGIFIQILMLTFGFLLMCNEQIINEWKRMATFDPLTGIWNRAAIEKSGNHAFEQAKRSGAPLSVLLGDIDYFKSINDTLGHEGGDRALRLVVDTLQNFLRAGDIMGRYGGEEFLFIAPNTNALDALQLAERLRLAISQTPLENTGGAMSLTVSFGVAQLDEADSDLHALIRRADIALYRAKEQGRNRVVLSEASAPTLKKVAPFPLQSVI
ncbi:MAG: GGDEF domain-containing protein [Armatimonadetes bacterium]|nr:GGDEF domain-containing protein [Armatimonadota bacterium]